jgi:DNA polymerase-1
MALNAPFQGSAADIIKIAMVRLDAALRDQGFATRLLLQVHDELVLESPEDETERARRLVKEVMEGAANLKVQAEAHVGAGRDWLSAK